MSRLSRFAVNAAKKAAAKAAARTAATTERAAPSLSVPRTRSKPVVKALPAPPKPLALPAPGPGLPEFAAKPRGGQWWADREISGVNYSPENAARETVPVGIMFSSDARDKALREWWERAVPKYIKNDFAGPNDPLRDLAERGLLHIPDTDADTWSQMASESFSSDPLQDILFPKNPKGGMPGAGDDFRGEVVSAMPWLTRVPATDELYGVNPRSLSGLDFPHIADEMRNAMSVAGDIPADLAVRPESLARMSFPQAVERVGRINQFRAKEMERAALSNLNSPAIQTFKEYADDNPMGLRWVELRAPENIETPEFSVADQSYTQRGIRMGDQYFDVPFDMETGSADYEGYARDVATRRALEDALRYEGDTMGHCVGGYCPDVMSGRSRIFSLRDAKGEPHVTVETAPKELYDLADEDPELGELFNTYHYTDAPDRDLWFGDWLAKHAPETLARLPQQDIVQIKGKQNRAPKDDYLPFVQDFVKSQQWGNVGDLRNTGLVKLPDGRYITQQQMDQAISDSNLDDLYQSYDFNARQFPRDPSYMDPEDWAQFQRHFEGFAIGGRVDADRCFCRHPMSVRKKK